MPTSKINVNEESKRKFIQELRDLLNSAQDMFDGKKFDINVDMSGLESQIKSVKNQMEEFQKQISNLPPSEFKMDTSKTNSNLDELKQKIQKVYGEGKKDLVVNVRTNAETAIATLKSLDGKLNKKIDIDLEPNVNGTTKNYNLDSMKLKSTTDNSDTINQKQSIKDQNQLYEESLSLLKQKYQLDEAITNAEQKGMTNTKEQLELLKEQTQNKIDSNWNSLSDNNQVKLQEQANELIDKQKISHAELEDKIEAENKSIQEQIEQYKQLTEIKLQNINTSGGKALNSEGVKSEIQAIKEALASLNVENYEEVTKKINTQLKQTQADIREINTEAKSASGFFSDIVHNTGEFLKWSVSATILMTMVNSFKEMLDYTSQLDKSITNIEMITDRSYQSAKVLTDQYRQLAQQMGQNDTDFLAGAEDALRAGLSDEDTKKMLQANAVASSISGVDNKTMNNTLQTMKDAFGLTLDQVNDLIDKVSTLDNKSSASFAGIAEGMQRSAAGAKQVGIQYDKLAAYITTVESVSHRTSSTVGQSFQSIFSRLENMSAGKSEDMTSINDVEKVLGKDNIGISLRSTSGEWKNMGVVIDEIAKKWKSLDSVTQSQIATVTAGEAKVA